MKKDEEIIRKLGGAAVVARFLNKKYTTVHNWTTRGIPAKYKLEYPELFHRPINELKPLKADKTKTPSDN
ncbi:hypothetical protein IM753_03250 [Moraxella sp. K127]|uniref:hypothetical protein n=1 Tax=Moraxella sp. K127 TaxID=2780079 RepID=UPI001881A605|nr:hypothetical protein [Moraxella sp. K127]MBE9590008.1 hypothetical protein [Moraxella sp. K127]